MAVTGVGLIAVTVSPVQVALGEIGSGGNLVSATCSAGSSLSQILVGKLEVVDDLLHDLVVRTLGASLDVGIRHTFGDERHLIPHLLQLVIEVGTEESYLGHELFVGGSAVCTGQRLDGTVAARDGAVELIPQFVELTTVGLQGGKDLHGVIAGVVLTRTALQAVVGTHVAVWPEIKRIGIPVVAQFGIGCSNQFVGA